MRKKWPKIGPFVTTVWGRLDLQTGEFSRYGRDGKWHRVPPPSSGSSLSAISRALRRADEEGEERIDAA